MKKVNQMTLAEAEAALKKNLKNGAGQSKHSNHLRKHICNLRS